jgi:hypothetical protein
MRMISLSAARFFGFLQLMPRQLKKLVALPWDVAQPEQRAA